MPPERCVVIGPNRGVQLVGNEKNVFMVGAGLVPSIKVDFDKRTLVFGDKAGPFLVADFSQHPTPTVWVRDLTPGQDLDERVVQTFEAFAVAFRQGYETDPSVRMKRDLAGLDKGLSIEQLLSRFTVEGEDEKDEKDEEKP